MDRCAGFWRAAIASAIAQGRAIRFPGAAIDITDRKDAELHRALLTAELNHRVKNTLAIVQAIASQSLRDDMSMPNARAAFLARLKAISNAHDLLTLESWVGADLGSIVHAVVDVYAKDSGRFRVQRPGAPVVAQQRAGDHHGVE